MAMTETDRGTDDMLESLFEAARAAQEPADAALMARVLADARAVQAETGPTALPRRGPGLWAMLGGWPAMGGLATATVAGLWLGFTPALGVGTAVSGLITASPGDVLSLMDVSEGFGLDMDETGLATEEDAG